MTTRTTSREAFRALVDSGELMGQQMEILDLLIDRGASTAAEAIKGSKYDRNRNLARARFTELAARGLIAESGQRKCEVTGRLALVWEATGRTKPLDPNRGKGVSKKTLAVTLVNVCDLAERLLDRAQFKSEVSDGEVRAIADARKIAQRA